MIAVIADDFTGAAEIGGLGLLYGFKTAILTKVEFVQNIDLLIIATEMRSLLPEQAAEESEGITKELLKLNPEFIYKKIDSVLRGNIVAEIEAQMKVSKKTKALIIPANPILNRKIKDGIYYIDGKPLNNSKYADNLAYLAKSSRVLELIGEKEDLNIKSVSPNENLPDRALLIGNTVNEMDLNKWAQIINGSFLPAGGAGFFDAILKNIAKTKKKFENVLVGDRKKELYICGSNFPLSKQAVLDAKEKGHVVYGMPDEIYNNRNFDVELIEKWSQKIINEYQKNNKVIVSVLQKSGQNTIRGKQIKVVLGILVKKILDKVAIDELFIEGGSTAYVIIKELNMYTFYPIQSLALGVTRMRVGENSDLYLTMKPGSYTWPKSVWKFN